MTTNFESISGKAFADPPEIMGGTIPKMATGEDREPARCGTDPEGFECCFCGQGIDPIPPDVCSLVLRLRRQDLAEGPSQEFFCHARCLRARIRAGIPSIID